MAGNLSDMIYLTGTTKGKQFIPTGTINPTLGAFLMKMDPYTRGLAKEAFKVERIVPKTKQEILMEYGPMIQEFMDKNDDKPFCNIFKSDVHTAPHRDVAQQAAMGTKTMSDLLQSGEVSFAPGEVGQENVWKYIGERLTEIGKQEEKREKEMGINKAENQKNFPLSTVIPQGGVSPEDKLNWLREARQKYPEVDFGN